MGPKPGYVAPSRKRKAQLLIHIDPDIRSAFKIATIEKGTTMQNEIVDFITQYSAPVLKRLKRKAGD